MAASAKHRIIIDTNLWISFLLTNDYSKLDVLLADNKIVILFSQELLNEFVAVANRPKFRKYFSSADLEDLLSTIGFRAEFITVSATMDICRDPKYNFLLALAKDGKATHLITGDKDLLVLQHVGKTKILSMARYLAAK